VSAERRLSRGTKRTLTRVQRRLERYYGLEAAPNVVHFTSRAEHGEREVLLIRELHDTVEMALRVPDRTSESGAEDTFLQLLEGVSHFVYVAERVRVGLPATQLELELQAEVDKFVLLGLEPNEARSVDVRTLHRRLFEDATYLHPRGSIEGERYRLANDLAARLSARLIDRARHEVRGILRRFYRAGQTEKIGLAQAA
jgi:hypothetical protein